MMRFQLSKALTTAAFIVARPRGFASLTRSKPGLPRTAAAALMDLPISRALSPMNDLMRIMNDLEQGVAFPSIPAQALSMDIKETPKQYEVQIDVPGVEKDNIKVNVQDHILTVVTDRKGMVKEEGDNFKRVERFSGHSTRSLTLPTHVDENNISAKAENGVLHIAIPKVGETSKHEVGKVIEIK